MAETWFYEFLFRGRGPGDKRPPAWAVTYITELDDDLGGKVHIPRQYSMEAMEAKGLALPQVIEEINTRLMLECKTLKDEIADLKAGKGLHVANTWIVKKDMGPVLTPSERRTLRRAERAKAKEE